MELFDLFVFFKRLGFELFVLKFELIMGLFKVLDFFRQVCIFALLKFQHFHILIKKMFQFFESFVSELKFLDLVLKVFDLVKQDLFLVAISQIRLAGSYKFIYALLSEFLIILGILYLAG